MAILSTEAMVLSKKNIREADRLYTFYTNQYGKVEAIAKGVRKTRSKLAGTLEPISRITITLASGKTFFTIVACETLYAYRRIKSELEPLLLGQRILAVVDRLTEFNQADARTYSLVRETLDGLEEERSEGHLPLVAYWYFLWRFTAVLGYAIDLYRCAVCGKRLTPDGNVLSLSHDGVLCASCAKTRQGMAFPRTAIVVAREIFRRPLLEFGRVRFTPSTRQTFQRVTAHLLDSLAEREARSSKDIFWQQADGVTNHQYGKKHRQTS